ncbi:Cerato-platanin [Cubamyces lactineus]|nr:Cerato-platanin [Cubamyces lactineus]
MQFTSFAALIVAAAALATSTTATKVTWDATYDNKNGDLNTVACSNGKNGLVTKGYTTFGSLPDPYVGGVAGVTWNSTECGSCWKLSYKGNNINVIAIDYAAQGFNIGKGAMKALAGDAGVAAGSVDAQSIQLTNINCGFQDY